MGSKRTLSNRKWKSQNTETWGVQLPIGKKALIKQYAESLGMTPSAYVLDLIERDSGISMKRENIREKSEK